MKVVNWYYNGPNVPLYTLYTTNTIWTLNIDDQHGCGVRCKKNSMMEVSHRKGECEKGYKDRRDGERMLCDKIMQDNVDVV